MVIIAVSGMPGAGSSTNSKLLAKKLNLSHFSAGDYYKKNASYLGEKETKTATEALKKKGVDISIEKIQDDMAKKGNVVIEAKIAVHYLKGKNDFSIWLKASDRVRAERIMGRDDLKEKEAVKIINERDKIEREKFKKTYGFDTFDQEKEADFIVDTENKIPEQITDIIIKEMKRRNII